MDQQDTTESLVCLETQENQGQQETRVHQEDWELRWLEDLGMRNQPAKWP